MAENIVEGLRQVIRDPLVPEFKALQSEVRHLQETVAARCDALRALRVERGARFDKVDERFQKVDQRFVAIMEAIAEMKRSDVMMLGRLDNTWERVNWSDTMRQMQVALQKVADRVA